MRRILFWVWTAVVVFVFVLPDLYGLPAEGWGLVPTRLLGLVFSLFFLTAPIWGAGLAAGWAALWVAERTGLVDTPERADPSEPRSQDGAPALKRGAAQRALVALFGSVLAVPILTVACVSIWWSYFLPGAEAVSPDSLPDEFPVLGFWSDSNGDHCEVFLHRELSGDPPASLVPPRLAQEVCDESFSVFRTTSVWPSTQRRQYPGEARFELKRLEDQVVEVHVWHALHEDAPIESVYRVRQGTSSVFDARYSRFHGPNRASVMFILSLPIALLVYLVPAVVWVLRAPRAP